MAHYFSPNRCLQLPVASRLPSESIPGTGRLLHLRRLSADAAEIWFISRSGLMPAESFVAGLKDGRAGDAWHRPCGSLRRLDPPVE